MLLPRRARSLPSGSRLRALETELDSIINKIRELKKYGNIKYTGSLKIIKKHDHKRRNRYEFRPIMQLSLGKYVAKLYNLRNIPGIRPPQAK